MTRLPPFSEGLKGKHRKTMTYKIIFTVIRKKKDPLRESVKYKDMGTWHPTRNTANLKIQLSYTFTTAKHSDFHLAHKFIFLYCIPILGGKNFIDTITP